LCASDCYPFLHICFHRVISLLTCASYCRRLFDICDSHCHPFFTFFITLPSLSNHLCPVHIATPPLTFASHCTPSKSRSFPHVPLNVLLSHVVSFHWVFFS
jgi:hypothetical protein